MIFKRKYRLILLLLPLINVKNEYNNYLCQTNNHLIKEYNSDKTLYKIFLHKIQQRKMIN